MSDEKAPTHSTPESNGPAFDDHLERPISDPGEASLHDAQVAQMLTHTIDVGALAEVVQKQEAADAADTLESLQEQERLDLLEEMDDRPAAESLAEMNRPLAISALQDLVTEGKAAYASHLLELMAPDDATDLLQGLDRPLRDQLLATIPLKEARMLRRLVRYDIESAGGLMTTDFIALRQTLTVAQATEEVRARKLPQELQHLLIIDDGGHLVGVVSLRALLLTPPDVRLEDIMETDVKAVRSETDREEVASIFDRYDFYMLAVVDANDRLIGIVTVDDVIDTIRAEQTEDVQKTVGAGGAEAVYSTIRTKFRGRFPWLGFSLVLTCVAALVVLFAEGLIEQHPILAFLLPVIAALVGNAGHQALAVTLRGIVLDEVRPERLWPLILREAAVGLLSGVVLGIGIAVIVAALSLTIESASWQIGVAAGIAAMVAMGVGTLAGSGIPLLMKRLGADPAQSSAIFLIMVTDAVSFSTLLALTMVVLG